MIFCCVIMAYCRSRRLRTIQNTIFLLLAVADFGITAFVEPTYVVTMLRGLLGIPSCPLWDVEIVLSVLFVQLSLVIIVLLSWHSYITLAYPYHYQIIITKSRLIVTIVISFLLVSFITFGAFLHENILIYGPSAIILATISTVIFTWCWTYKLVARHRKAIQTTQTPSTSQNIARKRSVRSTITAFVIIASLLISYFPSLFLIFSKILLNPSHHIQGKFRNIWPIAMTFMYLNSLLNPCLVFWRNTSFRETVENIFTR